MQRGVQVLVVSVSVLMLSGFAASLVVPPASTADSAPAVDPHEPGSSSKLNVVEVFTGAWCPPCANADPALSRIADEYGPDMLLLEYHCCQNTNPTGANYDPYYDPSVYGVRRSFYVPGSFGIPTVFFDGGGPYPDGTLVDVGASASIPSNYMTYRNELTDWVETTSPIAMSVTGDLTPTTATASVAITPTDPVAATNLYLRAVLYEESLYFLGTNGQPLHRYTVRALNEQPITLPSVGNTLSIDVPFPLNPTWKLNKLGVAALVQSGDTIPVTSSGYSFTIADILNAGKHDFVNRGILVVGDAGSAADYLETYQKLAAEGIEHYEEWNSLDIFTDTGTVDYKALPDAAALDEAALVIWHTGPESTDALTDPESALLGSYLDAHGSLLITGSNIGFWMWSNGARRTWYQTYLHATFNSDNTGDTSVLGVAGDPVSGPYSATTLGVLASPDRVTAISPAVVPFVGAASGFDSGVRAQHDADSRVLYMPFEYFENTIDGNRLGLMTSALDWIDGAAGPTSDVLVPDGGEAYAQGEAVTITWKSTDVRMAEDGIDIEFSSDSGNTWSLVASGEPNDGVYKWVTPMIDTSQARIRVTARDMSPESGDTLVMSDGDFTIGNPFFEITFGSAGWRFVSFPVVVSNSAVTAVLSSIAGDYSIVRIYTGDPTNPWLSYDPARGGDLAALDNTRGFWIYITNPTTLQMADPMPSLATDIPLSAGWNMVGFPSASTTYTVLDLKTATGATIVEGFDAGNTPYYLRAMSDSDTLARGEAYWVYVPSATTWSVPPN